MGPSNKKIIHLVVAARPNFVKIAPLYRALNKENWAEPLIVHTGQHFDTDMSDIFWQDFELPNPHVHLGIGNGSHAEQTGRVMMAYEKVLIEEQPHLVIVVGDVNSTVAATLAAAKLGIKVAHLEAGLRSFDRSMPEEINRVVTDALSDILWTPFPEGDENLVREGIAEEKIERVGNIMIDSLEMLRQKIEKEHIYEDYAVTPGKYGLVTIHRPFNVDSSDILGSLCQSLICVAAKIPLVFSVHPRTRKNLEKNGSFTKLSKVKGLQLLGPLSYVNFMNLVFNSGLLITDSGGLQEETTYLGIPCLTIRPNTERPITIHRGTNRLCRPEEIEKQVNAILFNKIPKKQNIELWDGKTAGRVVQSIIKFI